MKGIYWMVLAAFAAGGSLAAVADEGMWTYNQLPLDQLQKEYGFKPAQAWIDHLMKSSVRFNNGGSGSFISGTGLVLTNHHVASDTLTKISTPDHDYYASGFYAPTNAQEIAAPDLELDQLLSIMDVTARVNAAVTPGMTDEQAAQARRAIIAKIEKESNDATGLRSNVITLYQGGLYQLYRYKRYTDVRLVFAPEFGAAFYGGDPDNFEFPRYDLDMAVFRVYEGGKPARIDDFFTWSQAPAVAGDLSFVSGNPGTTNRILTIDALKEIRDQILPFRRDLVFRREIMLQQFSNRSPESARRAKQTLFGVQNSRKAYLGQLAALEDPSFLAIKQGTETSLRAQVAARPDLQKYAGAWDAVARAELVKRKIFARYSLLEGASGFYSGLFTIARNLVRIAAEDQKPNGERLPEFQDQARPSLEQQLFSPAPVYADFEVAKLADSLDLLENELGGDDPTVKTVLAGLSPEARAEQLIGKTRLADVNARKQLAQGGQAAIEASDDPLIALARMIDAEARALRKSEEDQADEPEKQAYAQISAATFAVSGTATYPDATFSLRLGFGTIRSYSQEGQDIAPVTTIGGAFQHEKDHQGLAPWVLPASWHQAQASLDLSTPLNFVSTADIIGGNSGSPVLNRNGELIGLIFDGNRFSLEGAFLYREANNRAVAVHTFGIIEALKKIYKVDALVAELGKPAPAPRPLLLRLIGYFAP